MARPWAGKIIFTCRVALFAGFVALLSAPFVAWVLRVPELSGVYELRELAPWPEWRATRFVRWPAAFEDWLNDHFPSRWRVVQWHGIVHHRWLREPSKTVVVGRDDWLFYAGEKTMEDLVGRERLSDAELAAWLRTVEGRRAWWREHGADYLFVIAPNKSTVYPEKLPAFLQRQRRPGKLDQLLDYFTANKVNAPFVDLRGPLNAARGTFPQLYWPTDSHWSAEGLVVSSDAIMTALKLMGVPQRPRDERTWLRSERVLREGDCIDLLALQRRWPLEHITQLRLIAPPDGRITKTPLADMAVWDGVSAAEKPLAFERDSGVGRAVMFCDSFFRAGGLARDAPAQSPLVLNFQRFISIWPWRAAQNLASYDLVAAVAQLERPTIVIEQWTERYLRTPPPDDPEFQRAREAAIAAAQASAAPAPAANGAR